MNKIACSVSISWNQTFDVLIQKILQSVHVYFLHNSHLLSIESAWILGPLKNKSSFGNG